MPSPARRLGAVPDPPDDHDLLELQAIAVAIASGAGIFEVVRAAGRALDASLALIDADGAALAVAARSPAEEKALLAGEGTDAHELLVGGELVGELRCKLHSASPQPAVLEILRALVAVETERVRGPERASEQAAADFVHALLERRLADREALLAQAAELGLRLEGGGSVVVAHAQPLVPSEEDWRRRVLATAERGARGSGASPVAASAGRVGARDGEIVVLVADSAEAAGARAAKAVLREFEANLHGFAFAVGRSRVAEDPVDLHRAGKEALLAANVALADAAPDVLAFEETGAYRLLLPVISEEPEELERFYADTVEPLVAYDEQYEIGLVNTLETFLDCDANVAQSAQRLFTHRHTIRYRLERVRELSGLDVGSSDGRERLSLGLKAMRVLGIPAPGGPASEPGAEGGRVPGPATDRQRP
jgi:sugar diacid utilization regulator